MTWYAFLVAAVKSLPLILDLVSRFKASAGSAASQGIGYDRAVKETLERANSAMAVAHQVEAEAAKDHASKPDDTAFDPEFQRKD